MFAGSSPVLAATSRQFLANDDSYFACGPEHGRGTFIMSKKRKSLLIEVVEREIVLLRGRIENNQDKIDRLAAENKELAQTIREIEQELHWVKVMEDQKGTRDN